MAVKGIANIHGYLRMCFLFVVVVVFHTDVSLDLEVFI